MSCKICTPKGISFVKYNETHDAYYCGICYSWLEPACKEEDCWYCPGRPEKAFDDGGGE